MHEGPPIFKFTLRLFKEYSGGMTRSTGNMALIVALLWLGAFARPVSAKTLLVMAAGYNSCPAGAELVNVPHAPSVFQFVASAKEFVRALKKRDPDVEVLWSCYSGLIKDGSLAHIAATGTLQFSYGMLQGDNKPAVTLQFSAEDIDSARPLRSYFDYVEHAIKALNPQAVYLAGHSYGGWAVLQAGTRLAHRGIKMKGVVLLDPISPAQCWAHVQFFSTALFWSPPPGCQVAPRDFLPADMEALTTHSEWRTNLYQTRFQRLHATPLTYPGWENREMKYSGFYLFNDVHTYMATEARAWRVAKTRVERE